MTSSVTLIVPVFNEAAALPSTLPKFVSFCQERDWELVFVNDGSTDSTGLILDPSKMPAGVTILRHKVNRGYGAAVKTGISQATTEFVVTIDADGQHQLEDLESLHQVCQKEDADMVVGDRGRQRSSFYREIGKWIIRRIIRVLLPIHIRDVNSGMKFYRTDLARRYLPLCPDSMAFSDIITLVFISERHRVLDHPITVNQRLAGESTISSRTAVDTVREILNIITLFNPMRLFLPIAVLSIVAGLIWGIPIVLKGRGVSVGAMLAVSTGTICFFLGLIAEQLASIRRSKIL